MKAKPSFSLKDQLFNPKKVAELAARVAVVYPPFPEATFCQTVTDAFPSLGLKQRIDHIARTLRQTLPDPYPESVAILLDALPPPLDPTKTDDDFGDFIFAPFSHFVALYGCSDEHFRLSLDALREMTKRFSAEGPVRSFINAYPDETLQFLTACAVDENYHVRRLASEGTRSRLPWAQKLTIPHTAPLPLLDRLYADSTRYVTRSVANHLNDISKIDPDLVVQTVRRWRDSGAQNEREMAFIMQQALRTLVKKGYPDALALLGFGDAPDIDLVAFDTSTPQVRIGEALHFMVTMRSNKAQGLLVDYEITFASDGGKRGEKVFKLKQLALKRDETVTLRKKHPMRLMTTRRLYAGEHRVTLLVNGRTLDTFSFELVIT